MRLKHSAQSFLQIFEVWSHLTILSMILDRCREIAYSKCDCMWSGLYCCSAACTVAVKVLRKWIADRRMSANRPFTFSETPSAEWDSRLYYSLSFDFSALDNLRLIVIYLDYFEPVCFTPTILYCQLFFELFKGEKELSLNLPFGRADLGSRLRHALFCFFFALKYCAYCLHKMLTFPLFFTRPLLIGTPEYGSYLFNAC